MTQYLALPALLVISALAACGQTTPSKTSSIPSDLYGAYSCVANDKTEIAMGDRSSGHQYFDLDGDPADPVVAIGMTLNSNKVINLQSLFANQPGQSESYEVLSTYQRLGSTGTGPHRELIAVGKPDVMGVVRLLHLFVNGNDGSIGVMTSTLTASRPAARNGERFVSSDISLLLCSKSQI